MSNQLRRSLSAGFSALALLGVPPAYAQVGHPPEHSPYHDLRVTHQLTFSGGYLTGTGGRVGVGPKQGPLAGLRYSISLSGPLEVTLGFYASNLTRHLVDPTAPPDKRDAGTATQPVMIADGGFNFRLTGAKTWHGFLPYFGASLGAAAGGSVNQDNSGFVFNAPFQYGPHVGVRWYGRGSMAVWAEVWDPIWRLRYPNTFTSGTPPVLDASDPLREWTHNPVLLIGFGLTIRS